MLFQVLAFFCLSCLEHPERRTVLSRGAPKPWKVKECPVLRDNASYQIWRTISRHTTMFSRATRPEIDVYKLTLQHFSTLHCDWCLMTCFIHSYIVFSHFMLTIWRCKQVVWNGLLFCICLSVFAINEPFVDWMNLFLFHLKTKLSWTYFDDSDVYQASVFHRAATADKYGFSIRIILPRQAWHFCK